MAAPMGGGGSGSGCVEEPRRRCHLGCQSSPLLPLHPLPPLPTMLLLPLITLLLLLLLLLLLEFPPRSPPSSNPAFQEFQRRFHLGFLPALAADWLQGPHLFQLFRSRGFLQTQIAALYSLGFASNLAFGLFSHFFVDRLGRRRSCLLFSLLCSLSCLLQLSRDFPALAAGRLLGGVGTSLLFTSFESWYVHEHLERHDFPREWIPDTFSSVALWNGLVAVAAGAVAELLVLGGGPVTPFVAAVPFLAFSGLFAAKNWDENYGKRRSCPKACGEGLRGLRDPPRALLGAVQALVEGVILVFIFLWTPALEPLGIPLGIAFSGFMAASAVGSALFRRGVAGGLRLQPLHLLPGSVALLGVSLLLLALPLPPPGAFLAFLLLEFSCGIYFPAMGFLRRRLERGGAAGGARWLRVPLGLGVALGLPALPPGDGGARGAFGAAALAALGALGAAGGVLGVTRGDPRVRVGGEEGEGGVDTGV